MSVLVTGITGFVGSHLARRLAAEGEQVCALVRPSAVLPAEGSDLQVLRGDLSNPESYRAGVRELQPDTLIHLAWYVEHGRFYGAAENLDWVGHSLALLRELAESGCRRFVMAGSCAEYDWSYGRLIEDRTPSRPATLYGVAKNATREIALAFAREYGLSLAWARFFFLYGPGEPETRLVPSVTRSLLAGERAACSHGKQERDFLYVDDAAEAIRAIARSDLEGTVNVGTGQAETIRQVVELLGEFTGQGREGVDLGARPSAPNEAPLVVADTRRLRSTGWEPRWTLPAGLAETVRWWEARV